jgi:hypothetical protein
MKTLTLLKSFILMISFILLSLTSLAQGTINSVFNAVTIEDENYFPETRTSIQNLARYTGKQITTRIVFAPDAEDLYHPTQSDLDAANELHQVSTTMGEILDSFYWAWPSWDCMETNYKLRHMANMNSSKSRYSFTKDDYLNRLRNFLNSPIMQNIDIIEIGNEINAPWVYEGNRDLVMQTMAEAVKMVKRAGKKTALTLYYYPLSNFQPYPGEGWYGCVDNCDNAPNPLPGESYYMINWSLDFAVYQASDLFDYVLVSYYDESSSWCEHYPTDWDARFYDLHTLYPNAVIGFGECGLKNSYEPTQIMERMDQFYLTGLTQQHPPYFCKGNFWWFYSYQCVGSDPLSVQLWTRLADDIRDGFNRPFSSVVNVSKSFNLSNYPNPFNPSTVISFSLLKKQKVNLSVYDLLGRKISELVNSELDPGKHTVNFDGSHIASGIYYYVLSSNGVRISTEKMLLVK